MPDTQQYAEVILADLYDLAHPVNQVGTTVQGILVRDRWNHRATVRVVDHPFDSTDNPALFTNLKLHSAWKLGNAKLGTATTKEDLSGVDIVIPGGEYVEPEPPLSIPANFTVQSSTENEQRLTWTAADGSTAYIGYHLERLRVGVDSDYQQVATLPAFATTYLSSNLPPDTMVSYRLRRYSYTQNSGWALAQEQTEPLPDESLPPIVQGALTNTGTGAQRIEWLYSEEEPAEGFELQQLVQGTDTEYQPLTTVDAETRSYDVTGLPDATTIWYRIRSGNVTDDIYSTWTSASETTEPPVGNNPPVWGYLLDISVTEEQLPATVDISYAVQSDTALTNWVMENPTAGITMNQNGSITISNAGIDINSAFTVDNDDGSATSREISIEVYETEIPIEFEPLASDNFDRPNELLHVNPSWSDWLFQSSCMIRDELVSAGEFANRPIFVNFMERDFPNDCYVQAKYAFQLGGTNNCTLMLRGSNVATTNWYGMTLFTNSILITAYVNGELVSTIADLDHAPIIGATYRFVARGTTIEVQENDIPIIVVTDSTLPTGQKCGVSFDMAEFNDAGGWDDFEAGAAYGEGSVPSLPNPSDFIVLETTAGRINVVWDYPVNVNVQFELQTFSPQDDTEWQVVNDSIPWNARNYSITGLDEATLYLIRIKATDGTLESGWEETSASTDSDTDLQDPYNLRATSTDIDEIVWEWDYDGSGNDGFNVEHLVEGRDSGFQPLPDLGAGVRTYTDSDLPQDTVVWFRIRAFDNVEQTGWQTESTSTDVDTSQQPPNWTTLPNFTLDKAELPQSLDMNEYVQSDSALTDWSIPNYSGFSIDSSGLLTVTADADVGGYSIAITVSNSIGTSTSSNSQVTVMELGDVIYAPARLALRICNPSKNSHESWSRYINTHSQMAYEVPIGVTGGRPPFNFSISGAAGFSIVNKSPNWNPGMVSWAEVHAAAGVAGTYTVTVTDLDGETDSTEVTVVQNDANFCFVSNDGSPFGDGTIGNPISNMQDWFTLTQQGVSAYVEKICVYRGGSYQLPRVAGNRWLYFTSDTKPVAHIGFPGETAIINNNPGMTDGFHPNAYTRKEEVHDLFFGNLKFELGTAMGCLFRMWGVMHRHVYWKCDVADMDLNLFSGIGGGDNYGVFIYMAEDNYEVSVIDCHVDNIRNSGTGPNERNTNKAIFECYNIYHLNLDNLNITNSIPAEQIYIKRGTVDCTITSVSTWDFDNRTSRGTCYNPNAWQVGTSLDREEPGYDPYYDYPDQYRYCRFYTTSNSSDGWLLADQRNNFCRAKEVFMERCLVRAWSQHNIGTIDEFFKQKGKAYIRDSVNFADPQWNNGAYYHEDYTSQDSWHQRKDQTFITCDLEGRVRSESDKYKKGWEVPDLAVQDVHRIFAAARTQHEPEE